MMKTVGESTALTGTVMMKKKATESRLWAVLAPNLEIPLGTDQSAVAAHLSARGVVVTWPSFLKKKTLVTRPSFLKKKALVTRPSFLKKKTLVTILFCALRDL